MTLTKDEEIIRRGCKSNPEIILPTSSLMKILCELENCDIATTHYKIHRLSLEEAISRARTFFDENFKTHRVLTSSPIKISKKSFSFVHPTSPFNLPISFIESEDLFSGSITEFLPKESNKIIFKEIYLNQTSTEHTPAQYVHEITHTQIDSQPGCTSNYYDLEVLSIFLELVYAYETDKTGNILRINDSRRILELLTTSEKLLSIPRTERDTLLENSKYLNSSLKAYNLFLIYYYGLLAIRKEIIENVNQVFKGNITLDELLEKYDITFESSQDEKQLKKYFYR